MLNKRPPLTHDYPPEKPIPQGLGAREFKIPSKTASDLASTSLKDQCLLHTCQAKNPNFKLSKIMNAEPDTLCASDVEGSRATLDLIIKRFAMRDQSYPYREVL